MHKPGESMSNIAVVSFKEALAESLRPQESYDTEKWLYVPPRYLEYRYILGTKGNNPLVCIGINPSTAAPDALDNTLKSVQRIAEGNGFDSFVMFNVYPQRATDPDDMEKEESAVLHRENLEAFKYIIESFPNLTVWAAWGTIVDKRGYLGRCMSDMVALARQHNVRWVKAGAISKAGHPHHPLYLKKDSKIEDFDIESYVEKLKRTV